MKININEYHGAKQLHESLELSFKTINEFIKMTNDHLIQTLVFEDDSDIDLRLAIYECIKEEDPSKKAEKATEVINYYVNEKIELLKTCCYDFNLDQAHDVFNLLILKDLTDYNDESEIDVNIFFKRSYRYTKIEVVKIR